ncbi:MAG: cytochrome c oxidase subunit 3 family protein [Panacagrimonas sp.]|jgi:nitric oxide reductase NorE protein|nr:cytochrome c oxidase subunit 3 family protein [Panacagrimonas sp.]MCC2658239.1 cytochrome c oxidase subunit 3 family protein [Panacagrimonas sp.]
MSEEAAAISSAAPSVAPSETRHVPGEGGIWVLIGGDLVLFSVLFIVFLTMRAEQLPLFEQGRAQLNQGWGLVNTLLMLSSSWFVATAIRAARLQLAGVVARCFGAALACGAGFVVVKFFEYGEKISAGLTLTTNDFFMLYFIYTGIHLIHVTIGMGVLTFLVSYSRSGGFTGDKMRNLESGASFWHLVDLLWIVLFALLYLLGGA